MFVHPSSQCPAGSDSRTPRTGTTPHRGSCTYDNPAPDANTGHQVGPSSPFASTSSVRGDCAWHTLYLCTALGRHAKDARLGLVSHEFWHGRMPLLGDALSPQNVERRAREDPGVQPEVPVVNVPEVVRESIR